MPGKHLGRRIVRSSRFATLMKRANHYAKHPERLNDLVRQVRTKAETAGGSGPLKEMWESLLTLIRLIRAYAKGDYRQVPSQTLILMLAAVLYFLMPFDVIPDVIVGLGYLDDAAVIAWVVNAVGSEIEKFRQWEASGS